MRVLISIFVYNEEDKLEEVLFSVKKNHLDQKYDIVIIDDGSSDETEKIYNRYNFSVIKHQINQGVGAAIRDAIIYGRNNHYDILLLMAGNGKMLPQECERLIETIIKTDSDYVQGSRFISGGVSLNLPLFRKIMIKIFTYIVYVLAGFNGTDITCGFRAYRLKIFDDEEINIYQDWIERYEMEYYIHYKVIKNGYKITEVPVTMKYPDSKNNYSKIKPFIGWWTMIRPWIFLTLGIKL